VSIRLAIFDCDGTLVDSGATITAALKASFELNDIPVPPPNVSQRVIGLSLTEAMAALLPERDREQHLRLAEDYKQAFMSLRAAGQVEEPLFDGVLDLLDALEHDGWLLAVATGKSDRGLKHCLEQHDIHARFVSLQTADRHPSKPHPSMVEAALEASGGDPARTVVIGDTAYDMEMAMNAGVRAIGVSWGYHDSEELLEAGAEAVADTIDELRALLEKLW